MINKITRKIYNFRIQLENKKKYGLLLWSLVLTGYFLFSFNWISLNVMFKDGLMHSFFGASSPNETIIQAINYTITLMRGIGSIGAGFIIVKLGHKKSILISMSLLSIALPIVFLGNIPGNTGYWLFIVGRMIMAIGGTVLIIYIQPIISYFFVPKTKTILSRFNSLAFNFGAVIPMIIICIPGSQKLFNDNWQIYAGLIGGMPLILLIIYWIVAKDIDIKNTQFKLNKKQIKFDSKEASWNGVLRDKTTWKFAFCFGSLIFFLISPVFILAKPFNELHAYNYGKYEIYQSWLPIIGFIIAIIPGIWLVGFISKKNIDYRFHIFISLIFSIFALTSAYLCMVYIESWIPVFFLMLISGIFSWSVVGPLLNIPHEINNKGIKKISIIFSVIWGAAYIINTIYNVIVLVIYDSLSDDLTLNLKVWILYTIFICISIISPVFVVMLPTNKTNLKKILL